MKIQKEWKSIAYRKDESVIQDKKSQAVKKENVLSMQYLQGKRFHFAVINLIVQHECWLVLQDFVDYQGGFTWLWIKVNWVNDKHKLLFIPTKRNILTSSLVFEQQYKTA